MGKTTVSQADDPGSNPGLPNSGARRRLQETDPAAPAEFSQSRRGLTLEEPMVY